MDAAEEELARLLFGGLSRGLDVPEAEIKELAERVYAEDVVYREAENWPGAGVYRGREEVVRTWIGYLEVFEEPQMLLDDLESIGDRAVATVTFRSRVGDMPVEHKWGYVLVFREGRVSELNAYLTPEEAREAALAERSER